MVGTHPCSTKSLEGETRNKDCAGVRRIQEGKGCQVQGVWDLTKSWLIVAGLGVGHSPFSLMVTGTHSTSRARARVRDNSSIS